MRRSALLLAALASAILFARDGFTQETFEFRFEGCEDISGGAGAQVTLEVDFVLNASAMGTTGMSYSMAASSPDGVEFLLEANHPLPCDARCFSDNGVGDGDVFFFQGAPVDPSKEPTAGPLAGMGAQGQGYVAAIAYNPLSIPPFQLPAGDSLVGKVKVTVTIPEESGTVVLEFKDGLQGPGEPVNNGVTFANQTQPVTLGSCTINVAATPSSAIPFDADGSNALDVMDALFFLDHFFRADPATLPCGDGTIYDPANIAFFDSNGDGELDLSDAVHIMRNVFLSGEPHASGEGCQPIGGCPDFCGGA